MKRAVMALSLCALPALYAQQEPLLRIVVLEGQDALNNTAGSVNRDVTVQVLGPGQMPVSGATVTFVLPETGPSGTFPNGQRTLMVETNNDGRATASGIRPNNIAGPMQIRVSASYLGVVATAVIRQTNVTLALSEPPKPAPSKGAAAPAPRPSPTATGTPAPSKPGMSRGAKIAIVLAIIGGAAAGGIAVGASGGSSSSPGGGGGIPPIVITPGTPTVGGQ